MRQLLIRRLLLIIMLTSGVRADDDTKPRAKLSNEVQAAVDQARAAAPEIFADTIVRLVESGKIPQRELQVEVLEDAFHTAARAAEPYRLIAIPGTPPDTREMYRSKAGELGLDATTLQSRILRNLLTLDRAKARELFGQVTHPVLDPRPCEDALVAEIAPYYQIAAAIAQSAFPADAKAKGEHVQFLNGALAAAKSPTEVAAFAGALNDVALTPGQWTLVLPVLGLKLEGLGPDYRSFAVSFNTMQSAIERLVELARASLGQDLANGLKESLRKYVVVQLTAARCQPDIPLETAQLMASDDARPVERKDSFKAHEYFESADAKGIGDHLLRLAPHITDDEFSDLLNEVKAWTVSGSDADVLHQKATVLKALLQKRLTDSQSQRVSALARDLLATSGAQRTNPAEWMWQANGFQIYLTSGFVSSGTSK